MEQEAHSGRISDDRLLIIFCTISVTALFVFVIDIRNLAPIDHALLETIFQGKYWPGYVERHLGRYTPLTSMEYAWAARLLEPSAPLFYLIHAIKMALAAAGLLYCVRLSRARLGLALATWAMVFFSIGFNYSSVILQAGELNELLLTIVFIGVVLLKESSGRPLSWLGELTVLAATGALLLTLFYKEVAFALALTFGASEWLRYRLGGKPARRYAILLVVVALGYLVSYTAWRGVRLDGSYAQAHAIPLSDVAYAYAANDPVIVFVVVPLTMFRIGAIALDRSRYTMFDSFLLAACSYAAVFVVLRLFSTYYWLPAYGFAACGIAGIVGVNPRISVQRTVAWACLALTANNVTAALSDVRAAKNIAQNYGDFVTAISQWVWENPAQDSAPRSLVMVGLSKGRLPEIFISVKQFVEAAGLSDSLFVVKASEPTEDPALIEAFGLEGGGDGYEARAGDVLVYNPFQDVPSLPPLLAPSDAPIYRSAGEKTLPRWTIWDWLRRCTGSTDRCRAEVADESPYTGYAVMLRTREPVISASPVPLASPSYRIGPLPLPERMRAGTSAQVNVLVKNTGKETWPVNRSIGLGSYVYMSYRWLDQKGQVIQDGERVALPESMQPGDVAEVPLTIRVPDIEGTCTLVITPLQEGIRWFYSGHLSDPGVGRKIQVFQQSILRRLLASAHH
jgi:hypothetical protein